MLTAAHCLYDHESKGWLDNFVFAPGLLSMQNAPFGVYEYETAYIFEGFLTNYEGFYGSVVPWDIGIVILQQPVGEQVGWMAYGYDNNLSDFQANIIGYPGDKDPGTMWRADCVVSSKNMADQYFQYDCDTYPGSSGSSVYRLVKERDERIIYGVNVAESPTANTAVRINPTYFEWLQGLERIDAPSEDRGIGDERRAAPPRLFRASRWPRLKTAPARRRSASTSTNVRPSAEIVSTCRAPPPASRIANGGNTASPSAPAAHERPTS